MGKRNHCPYCLFSQHLDIFPGDNANTCHGAMKAAGIYQDENGEMFLIHRCLVCGKTSRAVVALDDNYEEILKILPKQQE
jgi:hypothetical protein